MKIEHNNLGRNDMKGISKLASLTHLHLSDNDLSPQLVRYFDRTRFQSWSSLEQLVLENNNIGPEGAEILAQAFEDNGNLQLLQLRRDDVTLTGASKVARRLPRRADGYRALVIDDRSSGIKYRCKKVCSP